MFDLSGRLAIVTGANSGIGFAIAKGLSGAGAQLIIVGRNETKNRAACERLRQSGGNVTAMAADVTVEENVKELFAEIGKQHHKLDILVNNVGTNDRKMPQDYSFDEWNYLLAANLSSTFLVAQHAFPFMERNGGGKIINVGSMLSIFGNARCAPYAAAKGGVVQLTKSLAQAWAQNGICVNAILPGWIETDLTVVAKQQIPGLNERVLDRTPMGRWGKPADLAGVTVFLASSASDFITGTALPVDGGYSSNS